MTRHRYAQSVNASYIPGSGSRNITAVVSTELHDALDKMAADKDVSKSELIRKFLLQAVTSEDNRL